MPNICRSSASLDEIFRCTQQTDSSPRLSASKTEAFISEILNAQSTVNTTARLFQQMPRSSLTQLAAPDSGLGSSGGSNCVGGPSHIEDWNSLSILLPRYVF